MSIGLLTSRRNKIQLGKDFANNRSPAIRHLFTNYRNVYNRTVRAAKKMYYEKQFLLNQSNIKKSWDLIFEVIKKNRCKSKDLSTILINNLPVSDPTTIANEFNQYFVGVASEIAEQIHPADLPENYFDPDPDQPIFDFSSSPVSCSEISDTINQLQVKKTLDVNGMSTHLLSKFALCLSTPLKHVITLSFNNGIVPSQLKVAKVIPIFKSGDKRLVENYRPISLLNVFSKVFEKVVHNRLSSFLNLNNLISPCQFGFRKSHATVHPLSLFVNSIGRALNDKKHSIAIFCDLKKAFDTVDHKILLKKLSKIGVSEATLKWFESYLKNRYQYVSVGSSASNLLCIKIGVPQGSILGPLLFLIYINDLPKISNLLSFLFADDTTLLSSHSDLNTLIDTVNLEFQKIIHFFRAHKLSIHPTKTKFMLFSNSPTAHSLPCNIFANYNNFGQNNPDLIYTLEKITSNSETPAIKFLGIYIDHSLSFKYHVNFISSKISKAMYFLRSAKNLLSEKSLKSVYYALIHCHLIYGILIWSSTNYSNLKGLEKKQKDAVRIVTMSLYNSHTEPLFKKLNILPLQHLITYFKLQFIHQFKFNHLPLAFNNEWTLNEDRFANLELMPLRNYDDFYVPFARIDQVKRLPLFSLPKIWNEFEDDIIKSESSKLVFNSKLKGHFINNLNANYVCSRLLCPHCHLNNRFANV
jgi:hypothetical protein